MDEDDGGSLIQGTLRPEAYGPLAEYFRRYIDAYRAEGGPIYAITVENEPHYENHGPHTGG